MLRPERMSLASIICVKQDVEPVLSALSSFGQFHIEKASEGADFVDYSQVIQKTEESLSYVNELVKQLTMEKSGLFDIFKETTPTKTSVTTENWQALLESTSQQILVVKKQVDDLNASLSGVQEKTGQLNHVKDMLTILGQTKADLAAMKESKLIQTTAATIPHKNLEGLIEALKGYPLFINRSELSKENDFLFLSVPSKQGLEVEKILKSHHAEVFSIPDDLPHNVTSALDEVNKRLKETDVKEKEISEALKKISQENRSKLDAWKETTENILALLNAKKKILQSGRLATIEGFVPAKKFADLDKTVHGMLGDKAIVLEKQIEEEQDPPTSLNNNRFVKPFEELTKLYGFPHYNEIDPTPLMAITFPILFGLMFGDMGHGLILLVGGLTMFFLIKKNQGIRNVCWITATCGIAAIVAGALYGEFFGKPIFAPIWFDPFTNVFSFLEFALYVGVAQILFGISLEMANFLVNHEVADAVTLSLPKIAFYLGAVYLITVYKLDIAVWFNGPLLIIIIPFILMVIAKPAYVAASNRMIMRSVETQGEEELGKEEHEGSVGQSLFESGDLVIRYLSNSVSYSRILALLMAHWALLLVTYTLAALIGAGIGGTAGFIVAAIVIIVGNLGVLALEGLIVFIHTVRLHFYEWFTKFYKGNGSEFTPFKQKSEYTEVKLQEKQA